MGKRLVITEKPSVARDICKVLGGFEDEGEYFENDDYVVTYAVGHLLTLAEPKDYDKALRAWTLKTLPIIPDAFKIKPKEGQKKRLDVIKKLAKRKDVDGLINACDAGREGEIIFRRIQEYIGKGDEPHQRLWLQSMTASAIRKAFDDLKDGTELDHLADAAWLRGVGDWLVGMNATRALTKRLKGRRERGAWSAGRVQTPTLGLLVAREREVLAHDPETYWKITAQLSHGDQAWEGLYYDASKKGHDDRNVKADRIFARARVDQVLAAVKAADAGTASETRKKRNQRPPLPFDLTSLQREANRRFSFSAKRTLNAAQRLYEQHKVLTYPRTDSRHLPDDYGETVHKLVTSLASDVAYRDVATKIEAQGLQNLDRIIDGSKVSDHFAIVPTGDEPPDSLSSDDSRIYDLVVRQFMASLMGPATWAVVERLVEVDVPDGDNAIFRTTARSLEIPGFLEALGQEEGKGTQLPALVPGEDKAEGVSVEVGDAADEEKETTPPPRYTESTLLRLMETAGERIEDEELVEAMRGRGLGTPATRADTIERLVRTGYARRMGKRLGPTAKGIRLFDILDRADVPLIGSPRLTGEWENQLQDVQQGKLSRDKVYSELTELTRTIIEQLTKFDHDELFADQPDLGSCPSCGEGRVVESAWGYRCSRNTQKDAECKFILWKERNGRYIDRKVAKKLIADHRSGLIGGFVDRSGRDVQGEIFLEPSEADSPGVQWNMRVEFGDMAGSTEPEERGAVLFPCPCDNEECEGIVETNFRYICQLYLDKKAKRGPVLPKSVCHRNMEVEEAEVFFSEEGRTGFLDGFTSRRGRPFRGLLFRKPTGKHGFEFPPRKKKAGSKKKKKASKKRRSSKKKSAARKKTTKKTSTAKKKTSTAKRKSTAKKSTAKKAAAKKTSTSKKSAAKKSPAKKKTSAKKKTPAKKKAGGDDAAS